MGVGLHRNVVGGLRGLSGEPLIHAPLSRQALLVAAASSAFAGLGVQPASSASSLKAKLDAQDASLLTKPRVSGAPPEAAYPAWLAGEWQAQLGFAGYELPAKDLILRKDLFAETNVPGFTKCSVAMFPDIGKERVSFPMRWVATEGTVRPFMAHTLTVQTQTCPARVRVRRRMLGAHALARRCVAAPPGLPPGAVRVWVCRMT